MRRWLPVEELLAEHLAALGLDYRAEPIADQPALELVGRAWTAFLEFAHADVPDVGDGMSVDEDTVVMEALPARPPMLDFAEQGAHFAIARQLGVVNQDQGYIETQDARLTFWIEGDLGQRVQARPSIHALTRETDTWAHKLMSTGFEACLASSPASPSRRRPTSARPGIVPGRIESSPERLRG